MATFQVRKAKNGDRRYRVIIRRHGEQFSRTFGSKKAAESWARSTENAIEEGTFRQTAEAQRHALAELIDRYIEQVLPEKPKELARGDQQRHLNWWRSQIGNYRLSQVTPALLTEKRDQLRQENTKQGNQRRPATVNRYLGSLSHPFSVAVRSWGWLRENPVSKVDRLREARGRVRSLSDDERERLFEACRNSLDRRLYPLVVAATYSGARRGELLALRWPDIDWDRSVAIVHDSKNRERRSIPLSEPARLALKELSQVRRLDTDLIFANAKGKATWNRSAWLRALEAAKVEDFTFTISGTPRQATLQ